VVNLVCRVFPKESIHPLVINTHFELVSYHKLCNISEKTMELELYLDEKIICPLVIYLLIMSLKTFCLAPEFKIFLFEVKQYT